MALVRDPLFWKRFSRAVHLDEEAKAAAQNKSPAHSYVLLHHVCWFAWTNEPKGQLDPSTVPKETTLNNMRLRHILGHYQSPCRYYCGPYVAQCPPLATRQYRWGIERMNSPRSIAVSSLKIYPPRRPTHDQT
jgi:hypothetical protein